MDFEVMIFLKQDFVQGVWFVKKLEPPSRELMRTPQTKSSLAILATPGLHFKTVLPSRNNLFESENSFL